MYRVLLFVLGIVVALFPDGVRRQYERLAFENPDECTPRPSFSTAIRTEGLLFVLVSVLGGTAYRATLFLFGLAGGIAFLVPERALGFSLKVSYDRPETLEWNEHLIPVIQLVGVGCVLLVVAALTSGRGNASPVRRTLPVP
jgi:hypothetical protein